MKTKRRPRRKRSPINAIAITIINHEGPWPEPPPAARPRSRERIFYDNLLRAGVTFSVEAGQVVGTLASGAAAPPVLADEIKKRESAIMRFIAGEN